MRKRKQNTEHADVIFFLGYIRIYCAFSWWKISHRDNTVIFTLTYDVSNIEKSNNYNFYYFYNKYSRPSFSTLISILNLPDKNQTAIW